MPKIREVSALLVTCLSCAVAFGQTKSENAEYKKKSDAVLLLVKADPMDWTVAETQSEVLLRAYPARFESYLCMMALSWQAELAGKLDLERKVATEIASLNGPPPSETPDWAGNPVAWAKGVGHRLDLEGHPFELEFTGIDGRKVDLASMRGKVVLIDFWATWCPPCIASLPGLKANYDKYHTSGLEVAGISWDQDQVKLTKFVAEHGIPWPQYFEGPHRKFGESLGIGGIPYTLLIDKQGKLRAATAFPNNPEFVGLIPKLLLE